MTTQKDHAAAVATTKFQAERDAAANAERLAFVNACNEDELKGMLAFLIGYSPTGFDHTVEMVTRDRAIRARVLGGNA
ncbi:hypothetical protein FXF51_56890 [Nonomuraea sp. PA05]|uniref:hypothetical protein n=1 Tax=Nonomuraea sp. PA05 TaxID=2604466 RepID=UPI0011D5D722|nr:hypothetical protein [Nonomuraea sp. PA05]TYB50258.1 hypothetical protein FXF51_56890 [Nonomuraea sp. PA05]